MALSVRLSGFAHALPRLVVFACLDDCHALVVIGFERTNEVSQNEYKNCMGDDRYSPLNPIRSLEAAILIIVCGLPVTHEHAPRVQYPEYPSSGIRSRMSNITPSAINRHAVSPTSISDCMII